MVNLPSSSAYDLALKLSVLSIAIWCVLSSLELIAARHAFLPGRALGPDLAALSKSRTTAFVLSCRLTRPPFLSVVLFVRLVAGLLSPFAAGAPLGFLLIVMIGGTIWVSLVTGAGDGADKIGVVACTGGALVVIGRLADDQWLCVAGIAWAAGQAMIVYATSGVAKLVRPFWRDGTAMAAAVSSYRSGSTLAAGIVRHRGAVVFLAWAIMLVEAFFPLTVFAPRIVCIAALSVLCLFHFSTALVMGLNTYPWAFVATYPYILMANSMIVSRP